MLRTRAPADVAAISPLAFRQCGQRSVARSGDDARDVSDGSAFAARGGGGAERVQRERARYFGTLRPSARVTPVPLPSTSMPGSPLVAGCPLTTTVSPTVKVSAAKPCRRSDGTAPGPK